MVGSRLLLYSVGKVGEAFVVAVPSDKLNCEWSTTVGPAGRDDDGGLTGEAERGLRTCRS